MDLHPDIPMRSRLLASFVALALAAAAAAPLAAQAVAQTAVPSAEQQIAAAVLPLPADLRAGATVMGYREAGKLVVLRNGTNQMRCLALYVMRADFHVACYHEGLEPFMRRGRELRDEGVKGAEVDSVRFREIRSGKLKMPAQGALYSLFAQKADFDPVTATLAKANALAVVYVPGATPESTGLSAVPSQNGPWLMFPGTPKAHIMMTGTMSP
jgi:hypothetical protein